MNRNFTNYLMAGALVLVAGFVPAAKATTLTTLQDWCVNVDGSTSNCNTGAAVGVSGGFDFTLGTQVEGDPATAYSPTEAAPFNDQNGLGIFSVTLTAGSGQFAYMYMDYDLNANASGSFSDSAAAVGTPGTANAASVSYEMFDPNVGGGSWWRTRLARTTRLADAAT